MLDAVISMAAYVTVRQWLPTVEMKTSFIAPARIGRCMGEGHVIRAGRRVVFVEGKLWNADGELTVHTTATLIGPRLGGGKMFIQQGDAQIFTVSFGSGAQTLVALGGWTGSWEVWADVFGALGQNWRTVGFDHRGTGATMAPLESITVETMVADLFAVLDARGVERCVLAAESSGGAVALNAALQQPQRFEGLVLVSGLYYRPIATTPSPFLQGLRTNYEATVNQFVDWCLPEPDSTAVHRWAKQILMRASQEAAIQLYECMDGLDLRPLVSQITTPTLLIHGDADVILPLESSRWLVAQMPDCHLEIFPGAGHAPMMTFPQEVAAAIERFFYSENYTRRV